MPKLGVIGSLVWDEIHGRDPAAPVVEEWGGIAYALASLDAHLREDWEIVPLIKVGSDLADRARTLLELHRAPEILVLANVWDVVSAREVAATDGMRALATAFHSIAATFGYEDGENIPLNLHLDMVGLITSAVDLPVTMDFEAGYGDAAETTRRAIDMGAVGGNLEDQMKPLDQAVADVEAVIRAGRDAGVDFVLNARTDAFVRAEPFSDRGDLVGEAVRRGRAYLEAGAPVVFVPGVVAREEIAALVEGLGERKVSVISVPG